MAKIPIVIGVTGHRDVVDADRLLKTVTEALGALTARCPDSEFILLSSLAAGADQLAAEAALSLGMKLVCPLPMEACDYLSDFSAAEAETFRSLTARAERVFAVPYAEEAPAAVSRDFLYRQAGIYVAAHAHLLLALWDGGAPKANGCGAAEAVDFMLNRSYSKNLTTCLTVPGEGTVLQIVTPRASHPTVSNAYAAIYLPDDTDSFFCALDRTNEFNRESKNCATDDVYPLLDADTLSACGERARLYHALYGSADALSDAFRDRYLAGMKWLSALGVALVLFFQLYDEVEANLFLPLYAIALLAAIIVYLFATRSACHHKYLEYRALAETLRVQFYLNVSGVDHSVYEDFTWSQRHELVWVSLALCTLSADRPEETEALPAEVKRAWIDGQYFYHGQALKKTEKKRALQSGVTAAAAVLTVALFLATVILEFVFPDAAATALPRGNVSAYLWMHEGQEVLLRGLVKILLGTSGAATLFVSNYYGKLSLTRKCADHARMIDLYGEARRLFSAGREDRAALLVALSREEIVENGG